MRRRLLSILGVGVILSFFASVPASSGPLHQAAMAEVQQGIDLCPTGHLDGAMEIFKGVKQQFPGETEAIGWARYWHANCLLAGWRLSEIPPLMGPVWEQVVAGEITSPTAAFVFGHQYARVLNPSNYLRSVCERTMEFYEQLENPGIQIEEKAGFLQVFLSRCYHNTMEYVPAAQAGKAAWEKGEALRGTVDAETAAALDVKPLVLAAWGRLEQAKAELHQGNVLLAQVLLAECAEEYCPHMERHYVSEVETAQEEARLELGLSSEVRADLLEKLVSTDEAIDKGLWLRATWHFANEAYNRGATEEAIAPMAVARTCYVAFPGWGLHIDLLWQRKIRGHTPNELFIPELEKQMNQGGNLERASIRIQLAEILAELNRGDEGLALLEEVPSLSTDPRLSMTLRVAKAHCERPGDPEAEVEAYEEALAQATGNRSVISYIVKAVRDRYWWFSDPHRKYLDWLDEQRSSIPDDLYRLETSEWLRDIARHAAAALDVIAPLLERDTPSLEARVSKIICLYRGDSDAEAEKEIQAVEQRFPDARQRERAYFTVAWSLQYDRPNIALSLVDRVLFTSASTLWSQDSLLLKAAILVNQGSLEEARDVLNALAGQPPGDVVGQGMLQLARLYRWEFGNPDGARSVFENILAASDELVLVQAAACRQYADMEDKLGYPERALEVCERGLRNVPVSEATGRGWIRLLRAWTHVQSGDRQFGLGELEELAVAHPDFGVRSQAASLLAKEDVR